MELIPNQDIMFRLEHSTLLPAAVLVHDLIVLGSGNVASPLGGVDCHPVPPLVSEGKMDRQLFQSELKLH